MIRPHPEALKLWLDNLGFYQTLQWLWRRLACESQPRFSNCAAESWLPMGPRPACIGHVVCTFFNIEGGSPAFESLVLAVTAKNAYILSSSKTHIRRQDWEWSRRSNQLSSGQCGRRPGFKCQHSHYGETGLSGAQRRTPRCCYESDLRSKDHLRSSLRGGCGECRLELLWSLMLTTLLGGLRSTAFPEATLFTEEIY